MNLPEKPYMNQHTGTKDGTKSAPKKGTCSVIRLLKALIFLIVIGIIGIIGYAYLGDLTPSRVEVNQPVILDAN